MLTASPRIELLNDWHEIDQAAWDQALASSPTRTIFQTSEWLRPWWRAFGRGRLLLIGAYSQDRLTTIVPLFAEQGMVYFVGSGGSDYLDFIGLALPPHSLGAIIEVAREHTLNFVGFRFYHVPDRSPTGAALNECAAKMKLSCFDEGWLDAPALRFCDWPVDRRPPAAKTSLVRHERALKKLGQVEVEHFSEFSQIEPHLSEFFKQHIDRWSETSFPSLFLDDRQCVFYHELAKTISSRGWLRFTRVALDDEPVAFHFGFQFYDSFLW